MKNLNEFNAERRKDYSQPAGPVRNGIGCPKCAAELVDSNSYEIALMPFPPRRNVHCPTCGFKGYRLA